MIGDPEPIPPDAGQITPPKGAGPVIDRVWRIPPRRAGGGPIPTRTMPGSQYPRPTRPLGALIGGWGAFAAVVAAATVVIGIAVATRKPTKRRLGAARGEITDAAAFQKRLQAFRRSFKKMFGYQSSRDVDEEFLKLRARLTKLESAASGFFPEANDMGDAALRDLIKARDDARDDARTRLDEERRDATAEAREARRRARPWET